MGRRRAAALAEGNAAYMERRSEVIKMAATVFREKGLRDASLNDIAASLGTDRASLYYYISGKQELFDVIVTDAVRANVATAEEIRDSDAPSIEKLRQLIIAIMRAYQDHYPYLYVFVQEDLNRVSHDESRRSRDIRKLGKRYDDAVTAVVQAGLEDGTFRRVASAHVVAYGIIGMVNWSHRWFKPHGPLSGPAVGEALAEMVIGGLQQDPAPRPGIRARRSDRHP